MSPVRINGQLCYLGLQVPDKRESGLPLFAEAVPLLTRSQVLEILNDPSRIAKRKRFPASAYIKSQGNRGSCQGYASAKALERARVVRGLPHVALSGEFAYASVNGGRDQGSQLKNGMRSMLTNGVCRETLVPWQEYRWTSISQAAKDDARRFMAAECYAIDSEMELVTALALDFMAVIAVHVGGNYSRLDSDGVRGASSGAGNHAVGAQDVRDRNGVWQFDEFGSWGRSNGTDGCAWLEWGRSLRTTVAYHEFFAIRAAKDDPEGENPPLLN